MSDSVLRAEVDQASTGNAEDQREEQIRQAEELLFSGPDTPSFAKELFFGRFVTDQVFPYPRLSSNEGRKVNSALQDLREFCDDKLDPDEIDRQADIPRDVIDGLGQLGVLGMTAPESVGGRAFSQLAYCKVLEELGRRCSAASIFVNAHHSIGMRALMLFGTDEQKNAGFPILSAAESSSRLH